MKNAKANRAERPDKALFNAIMGVFFLLFTLAPAYWAVYNYGEYHRTTNFIEQLNEGFSKNNSPEAGQEYSERFTVFNSRADRYRLEMLLSGAGAFILFGISLLLFSKAYKSRGRKNFYESIDIRSIQMPSAKIEVKYTNFQNILLGGVIVFFSLMIALIFYQTLKSPFSTSREIIVKGAFSVLVLALIFVLIFLTIRAKRLSVKFIDASGITRGDGRHFAWTEFCGVITQTARRRFGGLYVWRKEFAFENGETAWLIPHRIKNAAEVFEYINRLPNAAPKSQ